MPDLPYILVVDDMPENLAVLLQALKGEFRLGAAKSGTQAIELAATSSPDCILLDICLPDLDGYQVCQSLKSIPSLRDVPVIFVSALDQPLDIVKGFSCGAVDYVTKPIEPFEVRARIHTHVRLMRVQREFLDAKLRAEREVASKNHFLACVSHELRTPLQVILGTADLLAASGKEMPPEKYAGFLARLEISGRHLLDLVNDVLDITQIDADAMVLDASIFFASDLIHPVLKMMDSLFQNKQLSVTSQVAEDIPPLYGDLRKCRQVLLNLLSNAVKYTPRQGSIAIDARILPDDHCVVSVSDSGIGIPSEARSQLFSDYAQVDRLRDGDMGGKGLGLALSRRLVELHGGRIGVDDVTAQGSRFWFTLPVRAGVAPAPCLDALPAEADVCRSCEILKGKRVLVIEDDVLAAQTLADILRSADMLTSVARNAGDACRFFAQQRYDVILTDLIMPGVSGPPVVDLLRKHLGSPSPPIVITSSHSDKQMVHECKERAVSDFLVKPLRRESLLARLANLLR